MSLPHVSELPRLKEIFDALRSGWHVSAEDGALYKALKDNQQALAELFEALGFSLAHHPHQFFYFRGEADNSNRSTRMAVFVLVLVDWLSDRGLDVEATLFDQEFAYQQLPHLEQARYRSYMKQVSVLERDDLADLVQQMERFGFAERLGQERFRFRAPAARFLDLCLEAFREVNPAAKRPHGDHEDSKG